MIAWGTYRTREEALAVIARSGYTPGSLTITQAACPRTGEARFVLRLAYARHRAFPPVPDRKNLRSAEVGA